jgi:ketosteroid isomerase-like protein
MSDSPLRRVLDAIDRLDLEAAVAMFSDDVQLMTVFGSEGTGIDQAREVLAALLAELRGTHHDFTGEWNPEPGIWIAEGTATYELKDFSQRGPFQRLIVVHERDGLISQLRIYGTHELPLTESASTYREVRGPHGWLPTL